MNTRILIAIALISIIGFAATPSVNAEEPCGERYWVDVNYTELDFRAMGYLWDSGIMPGGTIAILPFTDYSSESLMGDKIARMTTAGGRRLADDMAYQFTRIGMMPIPYDDCYAALRDVYGLDAAKMSEVDEINALHLKNKSETLLGAIAEFEPGILKGIMGMASGFSLSREQLVMLGERLGADVIIRGSISEYGMQSKTEAHFRTFIPPFLGLWNKEKEGMIQIAVYMYDAYTGDLIWAAFEDVEKAPDFPMFSTDFEIMSSAEGDIARRIVSHLVPPPPPCGEVPCEGCKEM